MNSPQAHTKCPPPGICYMSKVDAIVELTANFQHLDALADLEKTSGRSKGNADEEEPQEPEAKPVNVSVKSAEPDEDEMPGGRSEIAELLEDMADEPWQRLQWHDQNVRSSILFPYLTRLTSI